MNAYQAMTYIYGVLEAQKPAAIKKVFYPGKPTGPFSQNLPSIVIATGSPAEKREYPAEDVCDKLLQIGVHVLTRDPLERGEQRNRGAYENLYPMLLEIAGILEADYTLGNRVDDLEGLDIGDNGPGHGWVVATYSLQEGR